VAEKPDLIVLGRHRDLDGRTKEAWVRRALLLAIGAFVFAGLLNVFGQRATSSRAATSDASLEVRAPSNLRGGLLFQVRFTIQAHRELENATLVLGRGWLEGMQLNTMEPAPIGEASRNGELALELGHVPMGQKHVLYLQFQVEPTDVGRRTQTVVLEDDGRQLLSLSRSLNVFP